MLLRITSKHFVAGISDTQIAPIIKYMRDWSLEQITSYCNKKDWKLEQMTEYKKYDTKSTYRAVNVRLAKDATVKELGENKFVELTFVDSSRFESDGEMWVTATPMKSQAAMCSFLEKGDVITIDSSKLAYRQYGDENKVAFNARNADVVVTIDLLVTLKERGFTPGADAPLKGDAPPKKKGPGRPAGKKAEPTPTKAKKNIPIEIDLDDDDAEESDDE